MLAAKPSFYVFVGDANLVHAMPTSQEHCQVNNLCLHCSRYKDCIVSSPVSAVSVVAVFPSQCSGVSCCFWSACICKCWPLALLCTGTVPFLTLL